ncbi:hypothetical protein [Kitasatospora sp. NPDC048407]|uniref:hypothetical protein n=1 Tax=Kitasatospora sp. NPDC048407 TaxID=3364051 RepID=UPI003717B1A4
MLGYGLAGDAHHVTAPPPDGGGLRTAMLGALADAVLTPDAVGYVNGHGTGTGTPANDTAELSAMRPARWRSIATPERTDAFLEALRQQAPVPAP